MCICCFVEAILICQKFSCESQKVTFLFIVILECVTEHRGGLFVTNSQQQLYFMPLRGNLLETKAMRSSFSLTLLLLSLDRLEPVTWPQFTNSWLYRRPSLPYQPAALSSSPMYHWSPEAEQRRVINGSDSCGSTCGVETDWLGHFDSQRRRAQITSEWLHLINAIYPCC